jgi:hypothetical protein
MILSKLELTAMKEQHGDKTRHGKEFRLLSVKTKWGKQRLSYQAVQKWNALSDKITECTKFYKFKSLLFNCS